MAGKFRNSGFGKRVGDWLDNYLGHKHADARTEEAIKREEYIFFCGGPRFNRWLLWIPVLIAQICVGSLYSWSIFNKTMDTKVWVPNGYATGANANAFTICVAMFGLSAATLGPWVEKWGPFYAIRNAIILTPLGWAAACLGSWLPNLGVLYAGYGILHGFGASQVYVSTCSCIQKWFPEFKGFATGIAVMGFGVGSFIWTTVGKTLLDVNGPYKYAPYQVQGIFAAVFLGGLLLAWPFMRLPPPGFKEKHMAEMLAIKNAPEASWKKWAVTIFATFPSGEKPIKYTILQALTTFEMALLVPIVFGQFITGVVFLSSASDMTQYIFGYDANFANFITSMLNLANFTGRVGWGIVSDKIGRKTFYMGATAAQTFAIGLMAVWIDQGKFGAWLLSFLLIGSLYGGGFGVLPAFVSDIFGANISAATHGMLLAVWALATIIGVPVFTSYTAANQWIVPDPNSSTGATVKSPSPTAYIKNSYWLLCMPLMAFICLLFLNVRERDRKMRHARKDQRVRMFCRTIVCSCKCQSDAETALEEEEYEDLKKLEDAKAAAAALPPTPSSGAPAKEDSAAPAGTGSDKAASPAEVAVSVNSPQSAVSVPPSTSSSAAAVSIELPAASAPQAQEPAAVKA